MFLRPITFTTLSFLLLMPFTRADDGSQQTVSEKLQGRWEIVAGINQGSKLSAAEVDGTYATITNNTIVTYDRDKQQRFRAVFRIDESKKPIEITMTSVPQHAPSNDLKSKDQVDNSVATGILKFDGKSRWMLCYALPGADRPEEFESPQGGKNMLFTLEKKQGDPVPDLGETDSARRTK